MSSLCFCAGLLPVICIRRIRGTPGELHPESISSEGGEPRESPRAVFHEKTLDGLWQTTPSLRALAKMFYKVSIVRINKHTEAVRRHDADPPELDRVFSSFSFLESRQSGDARPRIALQRQVVAFRFLPGKEASRKSARDANFFQLDLANSFNALNTACSYIVVQFWKFLEHTMIYIDLRQFSRYSFNSDKTFSKSLLKR